MAVVLCPGVFIEFCHFFRYIYKNTLFNFIKGESGVKEIRTFITTCAAG